MLVNALWEDFRRECCEDDEDPESLHWHKLAFLCGLSTGGKAVAAGIDSAQLALQVAIAVARSVQEQEARHAEVN